MHAHDNDLRQADPPIPGRQRRVGEVATAQTIITSFRDETKKPPIRRLLVRFTRPWPMLLTRDLLHCLEDAADEP